MSIVSITEREYRALSYNSSSSLKDFSQDRRKYYRKYILDENIKEKENKASNMGKLVETILMEPDRFDEMFFMSTLIKVPGGMLNEFIWNLSEIVGDRGGEEGFDFEEAAREAYNSTDYKIKFETVLGYLDKPENKLYYDECLMVNHLEMIMVTAQDVDNAEKIVFELKNNPTTATIVNLESSIRYTVLDQMKIEDYEIDGMRLKSMLDKIIIDHEKSEVNIYDLKCTWSVEEFYKEYYLFRKAYIQAYLYFRAVEYLANTDPTCGFFGYKVLFPKFIVCDSINYYQPLIYTVNLSDMREAYEGFTHKYTYYPGVKQIIEELQWAISNDVWTISKTNFDKGGILNIKD